MNSSNSHALKYSAIAAHADRGTWTAKSAESSSPSAVAVGGAGLHWQERTSCFADRSTTECFCSKSATASWQSRSRERSATDLQTSWQDGAGIGHDAPRKVHRMPACWSCGPSLPRVNLQRRAGKVSPPLFESRVTQLSTHVTHRRCRSGNARAYTPAA